MKTMKGIIITTLLFCSVSTFAQWAVIDTFYSYNPNLQCLKHLQVKFIGDGEIIYNYTWDPPSPSTPVTIKAYKTNNDGLSWDCILHLKDWAYHYNDLQFPNLDTGFVSYYFWPWIIIEKMEGGNSWTYINSSSGTEPERLFFTSGTKGYGANGPIFFHYADSLFRVSSKSQAIDLSKFYHIEHENYNTNPTF
jgi:hypothetical protein